MGASKDLFIELREQEFYRTASKKEVELNAVEYCTQVRNDGEESLEEKFAIAKRMLDWLTAFEKECRNHITFDNKLEILGLEFTKSNTGDRLHYEDDDIYKSLAKELKEREDLLKMSAKMQAPIFDEEGVEVPKVGIKTHSKSIIKINYK